MESKEIHYQLDSYQKKCQELEEKLKKTEYDLEKEKEFHKRYQHEILETLLARLCRSESELHCLKEDIRGSCNNSWNSTNHFSLLEDLDNVQHKCQLLEKRVDDLSSELERKENQFRLKKLELDEKINRQCLIIQILRKRLGDINQICDENPGDDNISKEKLANGNLFQITGSKSSSPNFDDKNNNYNNNLNSVGSSFSMEFECDSDSLSSTRTENVDNDQNKGLWTKSVLDDNSKDHDSILMKSSDLACSLRHPQNFSTAVGIRVRPNQPLSCPICHRVFSQKSSLKSHVDSHSEEKPYFCKLCEESFKHAASLNRHLKIHIGRKDFKCEICGKNFGQKGNLKTHIKFVHTKEKPFSCEICGKGFTQKGDLQRHQRVHERYNQQSNYVCNQNFSSKKKDNSLCHLIIDEQNEESLAEVSKK